MTLKLCDIVSWWRENRIYGELSLDNRLTVKKIQEVCQVKRYEGLSTENAVQVRILTAECCGSGRRSS